ncbi:KE2 family protein domain-containing protein [Theileria equi strain WA]|uniref:KE2 family protein domain-containing protein n=1 Tax=Theileria equi strain WA TaxID=1537102 RepID=L0B0R0_THEEQ|nr:KE2 family protein domain-containing protein [Theileria equi strain WA]AFZ81427.1 KE2 family protein domain-containing protein [Theileria equi strain WA]|eukprot:XP_004831093.1 KE2 family protein domain-containing protein [Theileria equi strain WA]
MAAVDTKRTALKRLEKERLNLLGQLEDLAQEAAEHRLVLKTLCELPEDRRCYRIVGGVAVERTVAEVKPALETHATRVESAQKKVDEQLNFINEEISKLAGDVRGA